jgi:hypothetical protein
LADHRDWINIIGTPSVSSANTSLLLAIPHHKCAIRDPLVGRNQAGTGVSPLEMKSTRGSLEQIVTSQSNDCSFMSMWRRTPLRGE